MPAPSAVDVVIVGAGVAGSTLAILLGRAGVSVELYEQHHFPRDKACAEGLMPAGVAVLDRLGLLAGLGGARFTGIRYHGFGRTLVGRFPAGQGVPTAGMAQRRLRLDAALFAEARRTPGVSAHEGVKVSGPIERCGRVLGVVADGQERPARLVVGSDGPRSLLRRRLGLERRSDRGARLGVRRHYRLAAGQSAPGDVQIFVGDGHEAYLTPLPDGEVSVAALAYRERITEGIPAFFSRTMEAHEELRSRLEGATPITELGGRVPLASGAREGIAPGLVLLGDAAAALDPVTGGGMAQALMSAELLARSLVRRAPGQSRAHFDPSDDVLAEFDRRRRAIYREAAALSRLVLTLVGHPRVARQAFGLLDRWPALYTHLLGAAAGTRSLSPV